MKRPRFRADPAWTIGQCAGRPIAVVTTTCRRAASRLRGARSMNSGSHRMFTTVTVITMVFAPFFTHNHWVNRLIRIDRETHTEACVPHRPCPKEKTIVNKIYLNQSGDDPGHGHNKHGK
jgi:hypothetical protein